METGISGISILALPSLELWKLNALVIFIFCTTTDEMVPLWLV